MFGYSSSGYSTQYLLYIIAFFIIMYAQSRVQHAYNRYKKIENNKHMSGFEVARAILDRNGLSTIPVELSNGGNLSDHYDPVKQVVRLSSDIYYNKSIASLSVAAHEVGHVLQHKENYGFISLRNRILPAAQIASKLGWVVLVIGFFMFVSTPIILYIGLAMIFIILLFQIVTLPVELNASSRAIRQLQGLQLISDQETPEVRGMLKAAAFTYIAAVLSTLLQILRIVLMLLSNNRRNND